MLKHLTSLFFLMLFTLAPAHAQRSIQGFLRWPEPAAGTMERGGRTGAEGEQANVKEQRSSLPEAPAGAFFDAERGNLPFIVERFELPPGVTGIRISLRDAAFAPVQIGANERPLLEQVNTELEVSGHVAVYRKQPLGIVRIAAYRSNPATGGLERLLSYRVEVEELRAGIKSNGQRDHPANSKLASGEWYRLTVVQDGVHRIGYEALAAKGLAGPIASDRINIYGHHFGLLPFINSLERPTDLQINAIEVQDGGDGEFGPGDRLLFFAKGPHRWDLADTVFVHTRHAYSDSSSYFVGIDVEPPVRISPAMVSTDTPTQTFTYFQDRQFHERESTNLLKSGRLWLGELFDLVTTYNFNFSTPFLAANEPALLVVDALARTYGGSNSSSFTITSGGTQNTLTIPGVGQTNLSPLAAQRQGRYVLNPTGGSIPVSMTFNRFDPVTSIGWLNYLSVNCRRDLRMNPGQLIFRDVRSVTPGAINEWAIGQATDVSRVWEVTDPYLVRAVPTTLDGSTRRFRVDGEVLREFVAFRDNDPLVPVVVGAVPNQDLHATSLPTDLVIVVPPEFRGHALRLAEKRAQEGMVVAVVSPQQVYNEFSSGVRDATAIKRYMRMLYEKAGSDPALLPRHLLLFGDGSYNNISQQPTNQNFIPSYQSFESINPRSCYVSDDYFGFLDPQEGESTADLMDIGVGRIPVSSVQQAGDVVNKILNYDRLGLSTAELATCSSNGDGGIPDWRTQVVFASDDQEGDSFEDIVHMDQSDRLARRVEEEHPMLNVAKVYLDAYQQEVTPGGERYPQAVTELRDRVQKGALLVNYVGHGGEVGWAHERFLDNGTITSWTNGDRLPLFVTATCEFTRWDDPGRTSAGELVLLNPDGGGIGLMTTSRLAFSGANFSLAQNFYDHIFRDTDDLGRVSQLGDVFRETKVAMSTISPTQTNHRNFVLIGDPSMRLAKPLMTVRIDQVTDTTGAPLDTLKALATVRVTGSVTGPDGAVLTDFNGVVAPTIFDKESQQFTLANDGGGPFPFMVRKNVIYRGRVSVSQGLFSFTFVVPRDINYQVGTGRISCYAESGSINAAGYKNNVLVGDAATGVPEDQQGPDIRLYMNDEQFVSGGITDERPLLLAKLSDNNGINTVGSSIGHDLVAVLDENTDKAIVLNDLYRSDLDSYRSGQVRYRLNELEEGEHELRLKAWDTHNNSAERTVEFVVTSSAEIALERVLNYPNPFTTRTEFFFEHNRPCNTLDVQVQVFTVSGRLIKTLSRQLACEGYRSEGLEWDGRDDFGDRIGRGVYVYRLSVATPEGERAEKFEKLVVLR